MSSGSSGVSGMHTNSANVHVGAEHGMINPNATSYSSSAASSHGNSSAIMSRKNTGTFRSNASSNKEQKVNGK